MQSFHGIQPVFDEDNLVSHTGLAPVLALAERAGLSELSRRCVRPACVCCQIAPPLAKRIAHVRRSRLPTTLPASCWIDEAPRSASRIDR